MTFWILSGIFLVTEIVLAFAFALVAQIYYRKIGLDFRSIFKGSLERPFLVVALFNDYPHALTFFSALKLATRLKRTDVDENHFNDYYLIGNLVSVAVGIFYVYLLRIYWP
jgi:hypothetical protein